MPHGEGGPREGERGVNGGWRPDRARPTAARPWRARAAHSVLGRGAPGVLMRRP
jgi:hypothetical protein